MVPQSISTQKNHTIIICLGAGIVSAALGSQSGNQPPRRRGRQYGLFLCIVNAQLLN